MRSGNDKALSCHPKRGGDGDKIIDITRAASDRAAAAQKASTAEKKQTFTSKKPDWINYLMMDDLQQPVAKLVGIAFAQTINENEQAKHKRTAHHRPMAIGPQDCDGALFRSFQPRVPSVFSRLTVDQVLPSLQLRLPQGCSFTLQFDKALCGGRHRCCCAIVAVRGRLS